MTKYTPGPWKWWPGSTATERELCQAQYRLGEHDSILYHGADWPMKEADVRLIARAPETTDTLRAALAWWHSDTRRMLAKEPDWVKDARRILAEIDEEEA